MSSPKWGVKRAEVPYLGIHFWFGFGANSEITNGRAWAELEGAEQPMPGVNYTYFVTRRWLEHARLAAQFPSLKLFVRQVSSSFSPCLCGVLTFTVISSSTLPPATLALTHSTRHTGPRLPPPDARFSPKGFSEGNRTQRAFMQRQAVTNYC